MLMSAPARRAAVNVVVVGWRGHETVSASVVWCGIVIRTAAWSIRRWPRCARWLCWRFLKRWTRESSRRDERGLHGLFVRR